MHCQSHLMYQRFREAVTTRCDRMMLETTQADARWRYPINAATLDAVLAASLQLGNKLCKRQRHRETLGDRLKPISLAPINCNQRTNIIPMELDSMTRHEAVLDSASSDRIPNCNTSSRRLHTWQTSLDSMIESQEVLQSASSSGSSTTPPSLFERNANESTSTSPTTFRSDPLSPVFTELESLDEDAVEKPYDYKPISDAFIPPLASPVSPTVDTETLYCDCGRGYTGTSRSSNLKRHRRSSSCHGAKSLDCKVPGCEATIGRSDNLKKHHERYHSTHRCPKPRSGS